MWYIYEKEAEDYTSNGKENDEVIEAQKRDADGALVFVGYTLLIVSSFGLTLQRLVCSLQSSPCSLSKATRSYPLTPALRQRVSSPRYHSNSLVSRITRIPDPRRPRHSLLLSPFYMSTRYGS
jgi:hypothetical protein